MDVASRRTVDSGGAGWSPARRDERGGWLPYDEPDQLRRGIEDNLRSLGVEQLAAVNLRLMDDSTPDQRFDDQPATMIKARDEELIGGVGLSNVTHEHLLRALERTHLGSPEPIQCWRPVDSRHVLRAAFRGEPCGRGRRARR